MHQPPRSNVNSSQYQYVQNAVTTHGREVLLHTAAPPRTRRAREQGGDDRARPLRGLAGDEDHGVQGTTGRAKVRKDLGSFKALAATLWRRCSFEYLN